MIKIIRKHDFVVLLIHNINSRAEKSSENSFTMTHERSQSGRSSLSYDILNFAKDVKKMLIWPCQQFWHIFQVKYLSHGSSNQDCSEAVLDEFCEPFQWLHLICDVK